MTPIKHPISVAALSALIVLQLIMLSALYAGIKPHPPVATPLFGIAPFIGASVATALGAMLLTPQTRAGKGLAVLAALMAAASFGPQKYFVPEFPLIWPAVICGQVAIISTIVATFSPASEEITAPA
ncbi:hypothetical protein ATO10_03892 [Actibacterium atlanticum]|uniref:Uncharacterized protein n=1 Tax=Actibacterium atlanticum TaxID=1461693 RepID=A0A058ZMI1_9RHOB|nr:hypothetical protein [Actibacterium atlanticum]KCV82718.1 hypothetical protein ATO10_03892 [Actibacterium atlanticum]